MAAALDHYNIFPDPRNSLTVFPKWRLFNPQSSSRRVIARVTRYPATKASVPRRDELGLLSYWEELGLAAGEFWECSRCGQMCPRAGREYCRHVLAVLKEVQP